MKLPQPCYVLVRQVLLAVTVEIAMSSPSQFLLLNLEKTLDDLNKNHSERLHAGGLATFLQQFMQRYPQHIISAEEAHLLLRISNNLGDMPPSIYHPAPTANSLTEKFNNLFAVTGKPIANKKQGNRVVLTTHHAVITITPTGDGSTLLHVETRTHNKLKKQQIEKLVAMLDEVSTNNNNNISHYQQQQPPLKSALDYSPLEIFVFGSLQENLQLLTSEKRHLAIFGQQPIFAIAMDNIKKSLQQLQQDGLLQHDQTSLASSLLVKSTSTAKKSRWRWPLQQHSITP
ncbi:MAG: hypothetical protein ACOYK8_09070 [Alphaproteobacteria bacterium]